MNENIRENIEKEICLFVFEFCHWNLFRNSLINHDLPDKISWKRKSREHPENLKEICDLYFIYFFLHCWYLSFFNYCIIFWNFFWIQIIHEINIQFELCYWFHFFTSSLRQSKYYQWNSKGVCVYLFFFHFHFSFLIFVIF